ncbi:protein of unknown function [Stenotrophomonas maltophilia]|nr:protein of unknown function [Stenotrophomonas maltophilia]
MQNVDDKARHWRALLFMHTAPGRCPPWWAFVAAHSPWVFHTARGKRWGFGVDKSLRATHCNGFEGWQFFVQTESGFSTCAVESDGN